MKYVLPKLCVDCKHYMWPGLGQILLTEHKHKNKLGKCKLFCDTNNIDYITGHNKHEFAHLARLDEDKCGKDAKHFVEK